MRIFVTGGAGFIGRNLVAKLLKDHKVTIFDNLENSSKENIIPLVESGASFLKGDILDYQFLEESCKDHDIMIHLAAKSDVSESITNPEKTIQVNVEGTINVVKCCIQNKIKKIIFASSAAVYGDSKELPITESVKLNPISPYGKSKVTAESEIDKFSKEYGLDYIIFRIFNVYGNGQNENYSGVITKFGKNISQGEPLVIYGDGSQTRDFISIQDVVRAFERAVVSDNTGTYNIASGIKISINELAETMMELSGKKTAIVYESKKSGDIKDSFADTSMAKKKLGFVTKDTLKEGLSRLF